METNSLLNVDLKITSKAFASRLKTVLPSIISSKQTVYFKKRFIGESGRLISDILSITKNLKIKRYLVTMDIEKAFDSLGQNIFNLLEHSFTFFFYSSLHNIIQFLWFNRDIEVDNRPIFFKHFSNKEFLIKNFVSHIM